jgi:hypothetical protein
MDMLKVKPRKVYQVGVDSFNIANYAKLQYISALSYCDKLMPNISEQDIISVLRKGRNVFISCQVHSYR